MKNKLLFKVLFAFILTGFVAFMPVKQAQATVSVLTSSVTYTGDGTTSVFSITFPFLTNSNLSVVYRNNAVDPYVDTSLVLGTDYTISGSKLTTTVVYPATAQIIIQRNTPKTQTTDFKEGSPFPADIVEKDLDKLTLITQDQQRDIDRSLKLATAAAAGVSGDFPSPEANVFIGYGPLSTLTALGSGASTGYIMRHNGAGWAAYDFDTHFNAALTDIATKASATTVAAHIADKGNPHSVTAAQIGADSIITEVNNNATSSFDWARVSKSGANISNIPGRSHKDLTDIGTNTHDQIDAHIASTSNPHNVTAAQVGNTTAQWNANEIMGIPVTSATVTNGMTLVYNSTSGKFEWSLGSGGTWGTITGTLADQADLSTALSGKISVLSGDVTTPGTGSGVSTIAANAVTNAKLSTMAAGTIKGNSTASSAVPDDLSGTTVTSMLDTFTTTLKGLVPAPSTATLTKFLRDDGSWSSAGAAMTASVDIYIDGNRADTYTADGTIAYPFKTVSAAVAAITQASTLHIAAGTYTEASAVTFPNYPLVVYGNGATLTAAAGITVQNPNYTRYDLNTVGPVTFSSSGAGRVLLQGGSITGNVTVNGLTDFKSISLLSGVITATSTAQMLAIVSTFTSTVTCAGICIIENSNFNATKSIPLIAATAGQLIIVNDIITNLGTGAGINSTNGATSAAPNMIAGNIITTASAAPVIDGTAVTVYSKNVISGTNTGTGYIPVTSDIIGPSAVALGSDATGDTYYRAATGALTRLGIGAVGTFYAGGTTPTWMKPNVNAGSVAGVATDGTSTVALFNSALPSQTIWVASSTGAPVTMTAAQQLGTGTQGQRVSIQGDVSATDINSVTFINGNGLYLNGKFEAKPGAHLNLEWDQSSGLVAGWYEISRVER